MVRKMDASQQVEIRPATSADLPSIVRMLADDELGQRRERFCDPLPSSYLSAFHEILESNDNELLVASVKEGVVGVLQLTFVPSLTFMGRRRALLEGVRVDQNQRSRGVGRQLVEDAIRRAKDRDCHLIQLTTNKSRPEAKGFYESLGFKASHEGLKYALEPIDDH